MNLGTITLWWCYVTGGALALAVTAAAWIFAVDKILKATKMTRIVLEWYWDRCKGGGKIITQKTDIGGR